jgi:hypothetical protein
MTMGDLSVCRGNSTGPWEPFLTEVGCAAEAWLLDLVLGEELSLLPINIEISGHLGSWSNGALDKLGGWP